MPGWLFRGAMLSREGREYMQQAPWLALWPGLCLTIVVYSLNMFGDAVRDLLDPRCGVAAVVSMPPPPPEDYHRRAWRRPYGEEKRSLCNGMVLQQVGHGLGLVE